MVAFEQLELMSMLATIRQQNPAGRGWIKCNHGCTCRVHSSGREGGTEGSVCIPTASSRCAAAQSADIFMPLFSNSISSYFGQEG